jgi:hypothetical protein
MVKIPHKEIDKIVKFMKEKFKKKFTEENINELKREFCNNLDDVDDKVYWSFNISFRDGQDQFREGIISKTDYEKLMKMKNYTFNFGEISKFCYLDVELNEITFSTNQEDVINFIESNKRDNRLMDNYYDSDIL